MYPNKTLKDGVCKERRNHNLSPQGWAQGCRDQSQSRTQLDLCGLSCYLSSIEGMPWHTWCWGWWCFLFVFLFYIFFLQYLHKKVYTTLKCIQGTAVHPAIAGSTCSSTCNLQFVDFFLVFPRSNIFPHVHYFFPRPRKAARMSGIPLAQTGILPKLYYKGILG